MFLGRFERREVDAVNAPQDGVYSFGYGAVDRQTRGGRRVKGENASSPSRSWRTCRARVERVCILAKVMTISSSGPSDMMKSRRSRILGSTSSCFDLSKRRQRDAQHARVDEHGAAQPKA